MVYVWISVLGISLVSLIWVFTLGIKKKWLDKVLVYLVAFSAGALLGDVFLHLLPEMAEHLEDHQHTISFLHLGIGVLGGIVVGLLTEKVLHWNHCHQSSSEEHPHTFAKMNLIGDLIHNLIDGLIIGSSFLVNIPTGIATSLAVLFHEIPQEIGDFWVLIHGGYSKKKALWFNFLVSLTAIGWAIFAICMGHLAEDLQLWLTPVAMGMFIYIAGSDLIPQMHKHDHELKSSLLQILMFVLGIGVMAVLLFIGHHDH